MYAHLYEFVDHELANQLCVDDQLLTRFLLNVLYFANRHDANHLLFDNLYRLLHEYLLFLHLLSHCNVYLAEHLLAQGFVLHLFGQFQIHMLVQCQFAYFLEDLLLRYVPFDSLVVIYVSFLLCLV